MKTIFFRPAIQASIYPFEWRIDVGISKDYGAWLWIGPFAFLITWKKDQTSIYDSALEEAARLIDGKWEDYANEYGSFDHETGATEYPAGGDEYVGSMQELADEVRALKRKS